MPPSGLIITRPQPEADTLSQRLSSLGIRCWSLPTLTIHATQPDKAMLALAAQADRWIFISANAVREGWPHLSPYFSPKIVLWAIGAATARRLADLSAYTIRHPEDGSDSEALLRHLDWIHVDGLKTTIVRGQGGREQLRDELTARGSLVSYVECYARGKPQRLDDDAYNEALAARAWINLQSREAALNLWNLSSPQQQTRLRSCHFLVSHTHIATALEPLGLNNVTVLEPGDAGLIRYLEAQWNVPHHE